MSGFEIAIGNLFGDKKMVGDIPHLPLAIKKSETYGLLSLSLAVSGGMVITNYNYYCLLRCIPKQHILCVLLSSTVVYYNPVITIKICVKHAIKCKKYDIE